MRHQLYPNLKSLLAGSICCLFLSGCAHFPSPKLAQPPGCLKALQAIDTIAENRVGTLYGERIDTAPWLRNSRFLQSFGQQPHLSEQQLAALLEHMRVLNLKGLDAEIRNISSKELDQWKVKFAVESSPKRFLQSCSTALLAQQLNDTGATRIWLQQLPKDDEYSSLQRFFGIYPLSKIPFLRGVKQEQKKLADQWGTIGKETWQTYSPRYHQAELPTQLSPDVLGIPKLSKQQIRNLLAYYAPVWKINATDKNNIPGQPQWSSNDLIVNTKEPVSFAYLSYGRHRNEITLQLNYVAWFAERPKLSSWDWVAGKHDAVLFRIHLNGSLKAFAYDSIHQCGCWYRLFLPDNTAYTVNENRSGEPVLMQRITNAQHLSVYIEKDQHQIIYVEPYRKAPQEKAYALRPFDRLMHLNTTRQQQPSYRAVFNPQGYVSNSTRAERWLFWPMGVPNPGALRRPGDHAISFIGKRFFDTANLLEQLGVGSTPTEPGHDK